MTQILFIILYFVPTIIAYYKNKKHFLGIFALNLFLGFTIIGWIIAFKLASPNRLSNNGQEQEPEPIEESPYYVRFSVMNSSEEAFFLELKKQLPNNYYIFPKVRIADILKTKDGHSYYASRNKILPRHVDFLICSDRFKPLMAIEINGGSHRRPKTIESDELKRKVFGRLDFPLKKIRVGESFADAVQEIITTLSEIKYEE